ETGDQTAGVEGLEELAPVGLVIASREGRGERRWGTGRDVYRLGRGGAARDEADDDALKGYGGGACGRHAAGCQAPEPGGGGGLVVTWIEALAFDGDAGFAKITEPAVSSGASGPGLAEHPGWHPTGGGEMPADLPAVVAAVGLGEEVVDAGGGAGDRAAAGQGGLVGEVPAGRERGLMVSHAGTPAQDLAPWSWGIQNTKKPSAVSATRTSPGTRPRV